jgi:hypothetical protein
VRWPPACELKELIIWSSELVVGQLPAGKNVSTEAEDIVEIRDQATTGEDSKLRRLRTCCSELLIV